MKRHHGYGHQDAGAATPRRIVAPTRRNSSDGSRWGLWLTSLLVAAAAVLGVMLTGASGASTGVPTQIQVGAQTIAVSVKAPTTSIHASTTTSIPAPTTTTLRTVKGTTVVRPLAKVTDHEDSSGGDKSSVGN